MEISNRLHNVERLEAFINRVSPRHPPPKHILQLVRLFERSRTEEVRACVSMPPRHAKTVTGCHALAWRCNVDPACKNAFISYSADLAHSKSREIRRLALESGVKLREDTRSVAEWKTRAGGGVIAAGVGGPLTGKGLDGLCIVDDPIKNREDADSATNREKLWDWFNDVLMTRLEPGGSVVVVATRWHPDDLIGRLEEHGGWEVINIPAIDYDQNTGQETALWPEFHPLESLKRTRTQIGEYGFASLYQGRPVPKGATIFDPSPARFELDSFKLSGQRLLLAVDPAATASTRADYSVGLVGAMGGYEDDAMLWILDHLRGQWTIPDLCRKLVRFQSRWKCPLAIEAVGAFRAIPDMLREADPRLILLPVELKGDKFARSQPYATAWNDGRVLVPTDTVWADEFISEHARFTGVSDVRDDQVDAGAHLFTGLQRLRPRKRGSYRASFLPLG